MRAPRGTGAMLGLVLAAVTLLRLPAAWASGNELNHVSGAWMALADDLARGTFYRPLHDAALGFGGTRFFPLAFALHAALLRAGVPLLPAGLLLSLAAGVLAVLGAARFLRRAGHPPLAAAGLAPLVLAGFAGQHALAAVRGDLLAAALAVWGLGALLPREPARAGLPPVAAAAACFTLGFLTKPTALAAAAAGVAFLALRGERRRALALAAGVAAGCAAAVAATDLLSGGRFLALVGALGPGGAGPRALLHAPARLASLLLWEDPEGLAVLGAAALAGVLTLAAERRRRSPDPGREAGPPGARELAALWLAAGGAATLAVLASPGTGVNHLVDVEAAAALLVATCARDAASRAVRAAAPAVALAGLAAAVLLWHRDLGPGRLAALRAASAAAEGGQAPLLSEDPLLPLCAGERPYAVDAWMLRLASGRDAAVAAPLLAALHTGAFRAVVLLHDADAPDAGDWFSQELGTAALAEIRGRWRESFVAGPYHVYRFDAPSEPDAQPAVGSAWEEKNRRTR